MLRKVMASQGWWFNFNKYYPIRSLRIAQISHRASLPSKEKKRVRDDINFNREQHNCACVMLQTIV